MTNNVPWTVAEIETSPDELRLISELLECKGAASPRDIAGKLAWPEIKVMSVASWCRQKGLVDIKEASATQYSLSDEGKRYAQYGLPERRALSAVLCRTEDKPALSAEEEKIAVMWLRKKGLADIGKDKTTGKIQVLPTDKGREFFDQALHTADEKVLQALNGGQWVAQEALDADGLQMLRGRKGVLKSREETSRSLSLTALGAQYAQGAGRAPDGDAQGQISQITSAHIQDHQKGKLLSFRKYHVESFAPEIYGGGRHPLRELMDEVREVFVQMGFEEIECDYVQPCFWNMDALFIPQDHPARDIQDTFYMKDPAVIPVTDDGLMGKIRATHENGGETGSLGWRSKWTREEAQRVVLRTHTTVNTIRYLSEHPEPPLKVFSVGRIFRNEATDATHLSELHQIEGIVMERGATMGMLIGTLKEFYTRIGFPDVDVNPSYYPYTEPSMDVFVRWKGRILEMGGAGIFRPEVTAPFGVKHQVLAWGLGLERLAMIKAGESDIRNVISNDMRALRKRKMLR